MNRTTEIGNKWKIKTLSEKLRAKGLAVTKPRMAIMDYLMAHHTHPTVDQIYNDLFEKYGSLSKTTVYNTLKQFAENGIINIITIDEKNICADEITSPHGHFICEKCGSIIDVPFQKMAIQNSTIEGNEVHSVHQYFRGICKNCKSEMEN